MKRRNFEQWLERAHQVIKDGRRWLAEHVWRFLTWLENEGRAVRNIGSKQMAKLLQLNRDDTIRVGELMHDMGVLKKWRTRGGLVAPGKGRATGWELLPLGRQILDDPGQWPQDSRKRARTSVRLSSRDSKGRWVKPVLSSVGVPNLPLFQVSAERSPNPSLSDSRRGVTLPMPEAVSAGPQDASATPSASAVHADDIPTAPAAPSPTAPAVAGNALKAGANVTRAFAPETRGHSGTVKRLREIPRSQLPQWPARQGVDFEAGRRILDCIPSPSQHSAEYFSLDEWERWCLVALNSVTEALGLHWGHDKANIARTVATEKANGQRIPFPTRLAVTRMLKGLNEQARKRAGLPPTPKKPDARIHGPGPDTARQETRNVSIAQAFVKAARAGLQGDELANVLTNAARYGGLSDGG